MKTEQLFAFSAAVMFGLMSITGIAVSAYELGKATNQHTLDNCSKGIDIMHNGRLVRCGVIEKEVGLAAAKYRTIKTCSKKLKEWEDGN